jgi:putative copper export protein
MDPTLRAVLGVCMRWIHIVSVVTLIGGFIYARFVLAPALAVLKPDEREVIGSKAVDRFRPLIIIVVITVLGSGMYNYLTKTSFPPGYNMWMGIKLLLVLHIFASAILYSVRPANEAKRNRTALSIVISGLIVIGIAAYLRHLSLT